MNKFFNDQPVTAKPWSGSPERGSAAGSHPWTTITFSHAGGVVESSTKWGKPSITWRAAGNTTGK